VAPKGKWNLEKTIFLVLEMLGTIILAHGFQKYEMHRKKYGISCW
jgi:hypothetical protein